MVDNFAKEIPDIRTVSIKNLVDIRDVEIDTSLKVEQRIKSFVDQIKTPYIFKCGKVAVKMTFSTESKDTFQDRLEHYLGSVTK